MSKPPHPWDSIINGTADRDAVRTFQRSTAAMYGLFDARTFCALRRYSRRFNDAHDIYTRVANGERPPPRNAGRG